MRTAAGQDVIRHLVVGITLTMVSVAMIVAVMQGVTKENAANRIEATAPFEPMDPPMCKDLGSADAPIGGCMLRVDETERRIIERIFLLGENPMERVDDVTLSGAGWSPNACYFTGRGKVYLVSCDVPPDRWRQ